MPDPMMSQILRRRIILLVLTDFLWGVGWYFVSFSTTVAAYLRSLGASTLLLGLLVIIVGALPLLLQLFGRSVIDRFRHRKRGVIILHVSFIIPYFLVAIADLLLARSAPQLLILCVILTMAVAQIIMGLIMPVWLDMVAQVIPAEMRGRYFGLTSGAFACGGILGGLALTGIQQLLGPAVFRGAFALAGSCFLLSMTAFALAPIPETAFVHPPEPSVLSHVRKSLAAVHPRMDFGRFVWSYAVQVFAATVVIFVADFASNRHGLHYPPAIFSTINLCQAIGGTVGALFLGWLVDRIGPRRPWLAITLVVPLVVCLLPFAGHFPMLVVCSLLTGLLVTHWSVGAPALLELSPAGDKSGYIAVANMAALPSSVLGPLLLARLVDGSGYHAAFLLAAIAGCIALCIALTIRKRAPSQVSLDLPVEVESEFGAEYAHSPSTEG